MTSLATALKTGSPEILIECSFGGGALTWRCAYRVTAVPDAIAGTDRLFDILIQNNISIQTTLDLDTLRYGFGNIMIEVSNRNRLQDYESLHVLDGGQVSIYLWVDGVDWTDARKLVEGVFYKENHDRILYRFRVVDEMAIESRVAPATTVSSLTWSNHRIAGGGGSAAGLAQPLIFGNWPGGIPLICVSAVIDYQYLCCLGPATSIDADYKNAIENVFDNAGNVTSPSLYTFYPQAVDSQGNICGIFNFGENDQAELEPLSCSIRGISDASGQITGTVGKLIEHPADIIHYLLTVQGNLGNSSLDIESIKTMRALIPGSRCRMIINAQAPLNDIIDRLLTQCVCARLHRGGKLGIFTFDPGGSIVSHITDADLLELPLFSKTPLAAILTNLRVAYAWNPTTGAYEGEILLDRTNNQILRKAYFDYGERPEVMLELRDVGTAADAMTMAARYIAFRGVRHDILELDIPYRLAVDILEGDAASLTLKDAASSGGVGWAEHPVILLEREFLSDRVRTRWLNPKLIAEALAVAAAAVTIEEPGPPFIPTPDTGWVPTPDTTFIPTG